MGLCGSFRCGCGITSTPAVEGAIGGELPTIFVAGSGNPGDPYDLQLNDAWAAAVVDGIGDNAAAIDLLPRGEIAYAQIVANSAAFTVITVISGLSVTFNAVAGRRYKATIDFELTLSVSSDTFTMTLDDTSAALKRFYLAAPGHSSPNPGHIEYVNDSSISGSKTWRLTGIRTFGSGNGTVIASATNPAFILVEDIGPL